MSDVTLNLEIDEVNLILESLGALPFVRVYRVIGKIQEQASAQMQAATPPAPAAKPEPQTEEAP